LLRCAEKPPCRFHDARITFVQQAPVSDEPESAEKAEMRRKVMDLRVLLLRIAMRLRVNLRSSTVQQVMYRCAYGRVFAINSKAAEGLDHVHVCLDNLYWHAMPS